MKGLARATAWGVVWAFAATALSRLVWLAALVVLARLLAPAEFGLFAFGLVFLTYVETIGDLGTGTALIHWPRRTEDAALVTFYFNLGLAVLWFALAQVAAPWVAAFFRHPGGEPIVRVLAVSFLLRALGNTHDALCLKELRFRARVLPETALTVVKGIVAVALAVAGFGVWSLVWGQLAGLAVQSLALWRIVSWRPRGRLPTDLVRPLLAYGRGILAVNVVAAVVLHADLVVVGRMLGATALGIYQMAGKVPEVTVTLAIWVVSKVLFAAFSRAHAVGRHLADAYLVALRFVSLLTLPAAAGLFLVARPLVAVLFGAAWLPAVPVLRALAIFVGLRSIGSHSSDVLKATGRTGLLAGLTVGKAVLLVPALVLAGRVSAVTVAATVAAVSGVASAVNLAVVSRLVGVRPRQLAAALSGSVGGVLGMVAVVVTWQVLGPELSPVASLAVEGCLGGVAYLAVALAIDRDAIREARGRLRLARPAAGEEGPLPVSPR